MSIRKYTNIYQLALTRGTPSIHHAGSVLVKAMKLSVCIPECSFCGAHLSTSRTAHAQNVWMFKLVLWRPLDVIGIPTGAGNNPQTERFGISRGLKCYSAILLRIFHRAVTLVCFQGFELQRLEFDKQNVRTGCQGVIERRLPSSFFLFFSCLTVSPGRDSALISGGSITCVCASHWSNTPSRKIPSICLPLFFSDVEPRSPHQGRVSPDNHRGAAAKM